MTFETSEQLRDFFFAVIESLPGGILLADPAGNLLAVNRKASELLALDGGSLQNRTCWSLLARRSGLDEDLPALRSSGGRMLCSFRSSDPEADCHHVLISRNDLTSPFLHVSGFFLALEDVTFPALMEMHLHRRRRFAAMQEMAEAMSQELKNPLGSLELYASILRRELACDPDNERIASRMLGAVRTMNHLLDNFVTFSSLPGPEMQAVDLAEVLGRSMQTLGEIAGGYGIVIDNGAGPESLPVVGDPALLEQLFLNIGMNAVESMEEGGTFVLAVKMVPASREHGPLVEIRARDEGPGIAPEHLDRVFDPFFSTKGRNRGLGLAISHYIAEVHGGLIRVESEPGQGAAFRVLLPVAAGMTGADPAVKQY